MFTAEKTEKILPSGCPWREGLRVWGGRGLIFTVGIHYLPSSAISHLTLAFPTITRAVWSGQVFHVQLLLWPALHSADSLTLPFGTGAPGHRVPRHPSVLPTHCSPGMKLPLGPWGPPPQGTEGSGQPRGF
uniref:Uncharacterized protein n=1 Tax=Ursus americanus TaxID=9643 RepID=A0A452QCU0_URSAM